MALSPLKNPEERAVKLARKIAPSKTYSLTEDFNHSVYSIGVTLIAATTYYPSEVGGIIDGVAALQQFARKALNTPRYRHLIYDGQYGSDLETLIGQDMPLQLLQTEVPRVIKEALIYDDRIRDVKDFAITRSGDGLYVSFVIDSVEGAINGEVTI